MAENFGYRAGRAVVALEMEDYYVQLKDDGDLKAKDVS